MDWPKVQARAAARGETDCPVCLAPIVGCAPLYGGAVKTVGGQVDTGRGPAIAGCAPICEPCQPGNTEGGPVHTGVGQADTEGGPADTEGGSRTERLALLSCSHVFHERCVAAFEAFALSPAVRTCPVCRAQYTKLALKVAPAVGPEQSGSAKVGDGERDGGGGRG